MRGALVSSHDPAALFVAVTADVDPDANRPLRGRVDAVSPGADGQVSLGACFEGLALLADLLDELSLPATLFWEGRAAQRLAADEPALTRRLRERRGAEHACHGYRHEDFAGTLSGLPMDAGQTQEALACATDAVRSALGVRPRGFRAPYCRLTPHLARALVAQGYAYDASRTRILAPDWGLRPYRLAEARAVWELALCRARDAQGRRISCYLWPMFEGNRSAGDYAHLLATARATCPGGLLQLALHPWHLVVSADGSPLAGGAGRRPVDRLRCVLRTAAAEADVRFTTVADYLAGTARAGPPCAAIGPLR